MNEGKSFIARKTAIPLKVACRLLCVCLIICKDVFYHAFFVSLKVAFLLISDLCLCIVKDTKKFVPMFAKTAKGDKVEVAPILQGKISLVLVAYSGHGLVSVGCLHTVSSRGWFVLQETVTLSAVSSFIGLRLWPEIVGGGCSSSVMMCVCVCLCLCLCMRGIHTLDTVTHVWV